MSEDSATTPDPVTLTRDAFETVNSHDPDVLRDFYAPHAVLDLSDAGLGIFEGVGALRGFLEDRWGTWGDHLLEVEEIVHLGHGVVFSRVREVGRLVGSDGHVEQRRGFIFVWAQDIIERQTVYLDIDNARAAAERLAESRS